MGGSKDAAGQAGELLAEAFLRLAGYRIRARRLLKWLARALLIGPAIDVVIIEPVAPLAPVLSSSHVAKLVLFQSQWLMGPGTCERFSLQFLTMLG